MEEKIKEYIQENTDILNNKMEKLLKNINKDLREYHIDYMRTIINEMKNISNDIDDINLLIEKNDRNKMNKLEEKIIDYNHREKIVKKMTPIMILYSMSEKMNNGKYIGCDLCDKKFKGDKFMKRYKQHFKDKHY